MKVKTRKESMQKKSNQKEAFIKCKSSSVCNKKVCDAVMLNQCSTCQNVQKSHCGKVFYQDENG